MLSDDDSEPDHEDDEGDSGHRTRTPAADANDPDRPWLKDFRNYLRETEDIGNLSIVRWWGVSMFFFGFISL